MIRRGHSEREATWDFARPPTLWGAQLPTPFPCPINAHKRRHFIANSSVVEPSALLVSDDGALLWIALDAWHAGITMDPTRFRVRDWGATASNRARTSHLLWNLAVGESLMAKTRMIARQTTIRIDRIGRCLVRRSVCLFLDDASLCTSDE